MMINTGKGQLPFMTIAAILSISLVVNLPGLAVTPMLGSIEKIFKHSTELEVQLLTVLPNLCIIPFVLLSGKLSLSKSKIALLVWALVAFLVAGILYFFAKSMLALIIISCLLGCGCGLLIPLAAGLLSDVAVGKYRMKLLGLKSGISNISLVAATYIVGWLAHSKNWHMPFLVYLIPVIPLVLTPFLKKIPNADLYPPLDTDAQKAQIKATAPKGEKLSHGFYVKKIWGLIGVYFFVCYCSLIISYYMPFLAEKYNIGTTWTGLITSVFFLAIFLPGTFLPYVIKALKQTTLIVSAILMAVGLALMFIFPSVGMFIFSSFIIGFGYGVFQPVIYDKTTKTVLSERKATLALAFVLTANYLSISCTPFIVDAIAKIFGQYNNPVFPFVLNTVLAVAFLIVVIIWRKSFVFSIEQDYT